MTDTKIRLIIFFAAKDGEVLYSQQKQDLELTGSDPELLIAKCWLILEKVGKTTRPFRYDLNQIPYDYTEEVTHRFKRLDLIECLKKYGQRILTLYRRQWSKPFSRKRSEKGKMVVWGSLSNSWEKMRSKGKEQKERYIYLSAEFQRTARRDEKAFQSNQCKEIKKNNRMGKTRELFNKI